MAAPFWSRIRYRSLTLAALTLACLPALAQSPARWSLSAPPQAAPGAEVLVTLHVELPAPWHMYSMTTPQPGPIRTTIRLAENPHLSLVEVYVRPPHTQFDPNFNLDSETYDKETGFLLTLKISADAPAGPLAFTVEPRYQLCNDKECLPPKRVPVTGSITVDAKAPAGTAQIPAEWSKPGSAPPAKPQQPPRQPMGSFLLIAFGFGLAAVFTPCVFPMIPITMSFFLNQGGTRAQAIQQALVFSLGIVVLFTAIGIGLSAALGPFAVVQLGSNPWVNGVLCLVFFAFGLSLLGAFEITLPTGLLTRLNMASSRGGFLGSLLMGLTFCLASFACVGPFVGTLLAASVGTDRLQPILGMIAFSSALASPFFLLALFPSFLQKMPRSGGWMARVKVVLGFVILAVLLKYLLNVDQVLHWGILSRERFLALWVVLFSLPGLYLLGLLPMEGVRRDEDLRPGRLLVATLLLGFAVSLLPGMFGSNLGELEAYIPSLPDSTVWIKNDLETGKRLAAERNQPILVAFTGYACTNCHWMKANLFPKPEVATELKNFVLVELYTDGTDAASEKNQALQQSLFQTVAIPFYAILDAQGHVRSTSAGLTRDPRAFLAFLGRR
jgi:thiol:disulfide interchange protein DsbD